MQLLQHLWRPRLVGLAIFALIAIPAVLFIREVPPRFLAEAVIALLGTSLVLICHGFRRSPCLFGGVLVFVMSPIIGQILLVWVIWYARWAASYFL